MSEKTFTNEDLAVALSELQISGLIEWKDDEIFRLTDKGDGYAANIFNSLPKKDRVALFLYVKGLPSDLEIVEDG